MFQNQTLVTWISFAKFYDSFWGRRDGFLAAFLAGFAILPVRHGSAIHRYFVLWHLAENYGEEITTTYDKEI